MINQYRAMSSANRSKVLYCFDCDDYDNNPEDQKFLREAKQYCDDRGYEFIWFCKDIEQVYIGKKIDDSQKKKEAAAFKARKMIRAVNKNDFLQAAAR